MAEGRVVKVQKAPSAASSDRESFIAADILTKLCYFYPRYSLEEARKLPYRHVARLIRTANRERAIHYLNLTQIATAPHIKGGDLYKDLTTKFGDLANG